MKKPKLVIILILSLCFVSFMPHAKVTAKKASCPIYLYASNQAGTSARIYRITWYSSGSNYSQVVNLNNGQSTLVSTYVDASNEISVRVVNGSFNNVTIEDQNGQVLYSLPYDASTTYYWFYNVQFTNCFTNTIVLH